MIKVNHLRLSNNGFTIVELLVAITVIGIASVGIASLFYNIQYTQRESRYIDAATRAAQWEVEVLRNNSYNNLTAGQTIDFSAELPSDLPGNKSGTTVISEPSAGIKRVDVTVAYVDNGRPKQVKLSALIGVIGLSQ